jgi:hypothetical protein
MDIARFPVTSLRANYQSGFNDVSVVISPFSLNIIFSLSHSLTSYTMWHCGMCQARVRSTPRGIGTSKVPKMKIIN